MSQLLNQLRVSHSTGFFPSSVAPPVEWVESEGLTDYGAAVAEMETRAEAIARMNRGLDGFVVEGIKTTIPLHKRIMADADFRAGNIDTKFMERFLAQNNNKDAMKQ